MGHEVGQEEDRQRSLQWAVLLMFEVVDVGKRVFEKRCELVMH